MTVQTRCISAFETHNNIPSLLSFNNLCPIPRTRHLFQPFNKTNRADKHKVPETKNTEEGSARRNITRKHDQDPHKKEKKQGGGGGGKGKWNEVDDGSE
mmetsp:Transcript_19380/g.41861  ORF Transcript_19380/g.41861 Transcript_19380/m.41861 type:complete len:99 (+) Transcript_19380:370-666(+)